MIHIKKHFRMISVVVPFYNISDSYFIPFIESIKKQDYDDYEVIIVDDGSTDVSVGYINEICGNDSHFRIIRKQHGGLSDTRNLGIKECKGNLLWIIDPDDIVVSSIAFSTINKTYNDNPDADILVFGFMKQLSNGRFLRISADKDFRLSGKELIDNLCVNCEYIEGYTWNKVFNLSRIDKSNLGSFDTDISSFEDKLWLFKLCCKVKKCCVIHDILYQYNYNFSSLSRGKDIEKVFRRLDGAFRAYSRIRDIIKAEFGPKSRQYYEVSAELFCFSVNNIFQLRKEGKRFDDSISEYKKFISSDWRKDGMIKYYYLARKLLRYL